MSSEVRVFTDNLSIVLISKLIIERERPRSPCDLAPSRGTAARSTRRWLARLLAVVWAVTGPIASPAQQPEYIDREPEIKAAYLYNFGRYVEWPARSNSAGSGENPEFVIGVVGDTPVSGPLAVIAASKKLNGRTIVLRKFRVEKDFRSCQILFIPAAQDPKLVAAIVKQALATATLVVGEEPGFARLHGQIGFYAEQNSVKFEINTESAEKSALKISSKLLSLGRIVGKKPGQ